MAKKVVPHFKPEKPRYFFKQWRKFRGKTQEELAEEVGVSASTISQLERGLQGFTDSTLAAFADALFCSPGDLLIRDPFDTSSAWRVYDGLKDATPETRRAIVAVVETMLRTGTEG